MTVSALEIVMSNVKDVFGLLGTGLTAVPFFRVEYAKRRAARLARPPVRDSRLRGHFRAAERYEREEMSHPSAPDYRLTVVGLLLLGLSFVISLVLPYLAAT
jgi:hypothetical protein